MSRTISVRHPAVAGRFYPNDPTHLRRMVEQLMQHGKKTATQLRPKALIVPHAGFEYSGPIAASGYAQLHDLRDTIQRVVLLGPSHFVALHGLALPTVDAFATPLGDVPIDRAAYETVCQLPQVVIDDAPHRSEHSLEVQLPFLQVLLGSFSLIPFAVGDATTNEVDQVLSRLWGGNETLIVVSSDLSHYHDYETARGLDRDTSARIEELRTQELVGQRACGYVALRGLLQSANRQGMMAYTIDLRNSGDTAGPRDEVVGYGAYVIC